MKRILVATMLSCFAALLARADSDLRHELETSKRITIRDWRSPEGETLELSERERAEFASTIEFQDGQTTAETYCQCMGDFRVTYEKQAGEMCVVFICHWQHVSIGEEFKTERQVFFTPTSVRKLKLFVLSRFPDPSEEKEANQPPQPTAASRRG